MPETCENCLGLVNRCVKYAHQTRKICQVLPYSMGSFEIHWVRQHLVNVVLYRIKNLQTSDMTVKLKRNLHVGTANIFF